MWHVGHGPGYTAEPPAPGLGHKGPASLYDRSPRILGLSATAWPSAPARPPVLPPVSLSVTRGQPTSLNLPTQGSSPPTTQREG